MVILSALEGEPLSSFDDYYDDYDDADSFAAHAAQRKRAERTANAVRLTDAQLRNRFDAAQETWRAADKSGNVLFSQPLVIVFHVLDGLDLCALSRLAQCSRTANALVTLFLLDRQSHAEARMPAKEHVTQRLLHAAAEVIPKFQLRRLRQAAPQVHEWKAVSMDAGETVIVGNFTLRRGMHLFCVRFAQVIIEKARFYRPRAGIWVNVSHPGIGTNDDRRRSSRHTKALHTVHVRRSMKNWLLRDEHQFSVTQAMQNRVLAMEAPRARIERLSIDARIGLSAESLAAVIGLLTLPSVDLAQDTSLPRTTSSLSVESFLEAYLTGMDKAGPVAV